MSKRKKTIYAVILLLGAAALLVDRAMSASPAQLVAPAPRAAGFSPRGRPLSESGVETATAPAVSVAATPFPDLSAHAKPIAHIRDLFAITDIVRKAMFGAAADNNTRTAEMPGRGRWPGVLTPEAFRQSHRLTAVMLGEHTSFAIVDGQWLRVGDRLDGHELIEITGTTATFQLANRRATLSVLESPAQP
jgi:hypothetical protein